MAKKLTLADLANLSASDDVVLELPVRDSDEGDVVVVKLREPTVKETLAMRRDFMNAAHASVGDGDRHVRKWFKALADSNDAEYVALLRATSQTGFKAILGALTELGGFAADDEEEDDVEASDDASFPARP